MSDEQKPVANDFNPDWDVVTPMVEEQQRMAKRVEELEAVGAQLVEALEQLMSIVTIHSRATSNSFAWAEMDEAKAALAAAKEAGL